MNRPRLIRRCISSTLFVPRNPLDAAARVQHPLAASTSGVLCLRNARHVAPTARCPADRHPCLEVVDQVCDQCDQDEQDQDDQEDDNVALHLGGCEEVEVKGESWMRRVASEPSGVVVVVWKLCEVLGGWGGRLDMMESTYESCFDFSQSSVQAFFPRCGVVLRRASSSQLVGIKVLSV